MKTIDFHTYAFPDALAQLDDVGLSEERLSAILWQNASRLLDLVL